jgi:hypothetical protein
MQFFSVSKYTSDVTVVTCCINSPINAHSLTQEAVPFSFLADNFYKILLLISIIYVQSMLYHFLVSAFTNEAKVSSLLLVQGPAKRTPVFGEGAV